MADCNVSSSNDIDDGCVESLFSSSSDDTSHYLSPSLQDLEIVESILAGMLENKAPSPETKAAELAMDLMSPPAGDGSGGVLLEEVENDEEIAQEDASSDISESQNSTQKSSVSNSSPSSNKDEAESAEPAYQDQAALRRKEFIYYASIFTPEIFEPEKDGEKKKKRKKVETSEDPAAARKRTKEVSENIRVLQSLVPGGNKMDVTTLLDELISYLKFLEKHNKMAERMQAKDIGSMDFPPTGHFWPFY